mmetsp:Transcript_12007/g.43254  ORF Transcript_12007/g.43254 Transcript_12007/m.43254 type:complete len:278 (-) Transcript_12007:890-1723(-)
MLQIPADADALPDARDDRQLGQKIRRTVRARALLRDVRVAVHVLPQQRHLLDALLREQADLVLDRRRVAAPLASARVRHDAKRARVVAPSHDGHERRVRALFPHGHDVRVRLLHAELDVHRFLAAGVDRGDQVREVPVRVRPRDEVREAVRLEQLVLQTFAHASQHADDGRVSRGRLLAASQRGSNRATLRVLPLALELPQAVPDLRLRAVAYRARVDEHRVRGVDVVHDDVAIRLEHGGDDLAVADVHLTAVRLDERGSAALVVVRARRRRRRSIG